MNSDVKCRSAFGNVLFRDITEVDWYHVNGKVKQIFRRYAATNKL